MKTNPNPPRRVIGFDSHPDTFTAALIRGTTPADALVEKMFDRISVAQLPSWAKKHTTPQDLFVLEASGNSFQIVRTLAALGRQALVLESRHLGKLKEGHANNDRISAVRIGKAYLAGTAKTVWVPDLKTQERRDWFLSQQKAVRRTTQLRNRLLSYLSDHAVRLPGLSWSRELEPQLRAAGQWTPGQWRVLAALLMELRQAQEQREFWNSLAAQEVLADPLLLSLVRLCGIRDKVAFALGAVIGDIHRFAEPRKLVSYLGLQPRFDDSGEQTWSGGVGGLGRKDLRGLLIESAQAILRTDHPLAKWGRKLMARKGSMKLAVVAVARRLTVSVWYLLMGKWTRLEEIDDRLEIKLGKIITNLGPKVLKETGQTRKTLKEEAFQKLKHGRSYQLKPDLKFQPRE